MKTDHRCLAIAFISAVWLSAACSSAPVPYGGSDSGASGSSGTSASSGSSRSSGSSATTDAAVPCDSADASPEDVTVPSDVTGSPDVSSPVDVTVPSDGTAADDVTSPPDAGADASEPAEAGPDATADVTEPGDDASTDASADASDAASAPGTLGVSTGALTLFARNCDDAPEPSASFQITNSGATPFTWSAAPVEARPYFTLSPASGTLDAGAQATIDVVTGGIPGLSVPLSDQGMLTRTVQLVTSEGDSATVTVHETIAGVFLTGAPAQLDFGRVPVGATVSMNVPYTLTPTLGGGASFASLTPSDPNFSVAPLSTQTGLELVVTYSPTAAGFHSGTFTWNATDLCNVATLTISGTAAIANSQGCFASPVPSGTPCGSAGMICIPLGCVTQFTLTGAPFAAEAGVPFSGVVANGTDWMAEASVNPGALTATVDWGDGTTGSGTVFDAMSTSAPPAFGVSGDHTYASAGPFTVTVTVSDSTTMDSVSTSFATTQ